MISISPHIANTLSRGGPVVALESTVIAHGLPRPQNLETALRLEQIVSESGATPATIGILEGKLRVGLDRDEIRYLAEHSDIKKISTRDLPLAVAYKWNGATTVATTAWIARRARINVFATGGIGGVHRGPLPDVSADLWELARTPIVVVCSGGKIVLDLPATREWLETHGVTVLGYRCDEMPAFYSRESGLLVDKRIDSAAEAVDIYHAQEALGIESALLVTVPVPSHAEIPRPELEMVLDRALKQAESEAVHGRELTPFLLSQMAQASKGATLVANLSLLENNARIAAEIAVAMSSIQNPRLSQTV